MAKLLNGACGLHGFTWMAAAAVFLVIYLWPRPDSASASPPESANITCSIEWVHDGDTFRCAGYHKSTRLYGVDAPEMPGACRPGRDCVPGDPYASRDRLKALIGSGPLRCELIETDGYGRPVMRCWAGSTDLSCALVREGFAVERYGRLNCPR
jgi:endonuclease YncB( thermonuclease family)